MAKGLTRLISLFFIAVVSCSLSAIPSRAESKSGDRVLNHGWKELGDVEINLPNTRVSCQVVVLRAWWDAVNVAANVNVYLKAVDGNGRQIEYIKDKHDVKITVDTHGNYRGRIYFYAKTDKQTAPGGCDVHVRMWKNK